MYLDDLDYKGLTFWYEDVCEVSEEIKNKNKGV
jgi:hypothetical protein